MARDKEPVQISGDIAAMAEVAVNTSSGSLSATLKKGLRDKLGEVGDRLVAAALQFATGQSVVLLGGTADPASHATIRVTRLGRNRFEVELETGAEAEEVDDMTAAFLMLKAEQFKQQKLDLLPAETAEQWRESMAAKFRKAEARAGRRRRTR